MCGAPRRLLGVGIGAAMTASYSAAGAVIPPGAHGAGFGVLTSASLVGMASSPFIAGLRRRRRRCGSCSSSIVVLAALAVTVRRFDDCRTHRTGLTRCGACSSIRTRRSAMRSRKPRNGFCDGGVVAIPTDTLYGLAADPFSAEAVCARVRGEGPRRPSAPCRLIAADAAQVAARLGRLSRRRGAAWRHATGRDR